MITILPPEPKRSSQPMNPSAGLSNSPAKPLAADYRLLGLRPREARVDVIRQAVHQAANQLQTEQTASPPSDSDQLTEIAVAGYRLLDPRRRRTLFERVQLLMWTEEELDATVKSLWASQPVAPPRVKIAIKRSRDMNAASDTGTDNENQVALELFRNIRKRDRRALAVWIGVASIAASLATALTLFAIFAS